MAFQLVDDLLGIWGDPAVTGKAVGSDLASRKKCLPVTAALESATEAGEQLRRLYARDGSLDEEGVAHAAFLVEEAGGRRWARVEADRQVGTALAALARAGLTGPDAAELKMLAALVTRREH